MIVNNATIIKVIDIFLVVFILLNVQSNTSKKRKNKTKYAIIKDFINQVPLFTILMVNKRIGISIIKAIDIFIPLYLFCFSKKGRSVMVQEMRTPNKTIQDQLRF